jgi:hypothetical protein
MLLPAIAASHFAMNVMASPCAISLPRSCNHVPVGHVDQLAVAQVDLLLARAPLTLRELDRHARVVQVSADRAVQRLGLRALQDVIVLDVLSERIELVVALRAAL